MIANRVAYGQMVHTLAKEDPRIVIVDSDFANCANYFDFMEDFPERFFQVGIAEQNMVSVAAGLATCGLIPFVASFSVFSSMRALDQVRNQVCYNSLNVKVVGTHAGLETGEDGGTHQSVEDVAIMRAVPDIKVLAPSTPNMTASLTRLMAESFGPCYMRMGRANLPELYEEGEVFLFGGSRTLREGDDVCIAAYSNMVHVALKAADMLAEKGIKARVIDAYCIKPLDDKAILDAAKTTAGIVTVEDHNIIGGLGGAVSELLCREYPAKVRFVGIEDKFGRSGTIPDLFNSYGLTAEKVVEKALELL